MSTARTLTLHPEGKKGVNIKTPLYEAMRKAILKVVPARGEGVLAKDLPLLVGPLLGPAYDRTPTITWYCVAVKQDLEARGLIVRVPKSRPQKLLRGTKPNKGQE